MDEKPQEAAEPKENEAAEQPETQADGYYGDDAGDEKELDLSFLDEQKQ